MSSIPWQGIVAVVIIQVLWGANPVAVKFGLEVFPPFWSGFFRFATALACIYLWAQFRGLSLMPKKHEWKPLALLGAVFIVQIWFMNYGFDRSTGAISSILISTHPLFAAFFSHLMVKGDHMSPAKIAGMAIAFGGTSLIIMRGGGLSGDGFSMIGASIIMFSSILLGWRLILASQMAREFETTKVVFWQMLLPLWAFALGGFLFEEIRWEHMGWVPVGGILYQGIVIAGLGFMVNTWLLKTYKPSVVVSFAFIAPLSGVMLSVWLLDEHITWVIAIGAACVGVGLILITRTQKQAS